jgi:hypothetical protein
MIFGAWPSLKMELEGHHAIGFNDENTIILGVDVFCAMGFHLFLGDRTGLRTANSDEDGYLVLLDLLEPIRRFAQTDPNGGGGHRFVEEIGRFTQKDQGRLMTSLGNSKRGDQAEIRAGRII